MMDKMLLTPLISIEGLIYSEGQVLLTWTMGPKLCKWIENLGTSWRKHWKFFSSFNLNEWKAGWLLPAFHFVPQFQDHYPSQVLSANPNSTLPLHFEGKGKTDIFVCVSARITIFLVSWFPRHNKSKNHIASIKVKILCELQFFFFVLQMFTI